MTFQISNISNVLFSISEHQLDISLLYLIQMDNICLSVMLKGK